MPVNCVPDHAVNCRFNNGEASAAADMDILEKWN